MDGFPRCRPRWTHRLLTEPLEARRETVGPFFETATVYSRPSRHAGITTFVAVIRPRADRSDDDKGRRALIQVG